MHCSEQAEAHFRTNFFSLMDVVREIFPILRKQKDGVIFNVASINGRVKIIEPGVINTNFYGRSIVLKTRKGKIIHEFKC